MTDIRIALFTRAPVPGAAKTRLIPALGAQGAADLHAALTAHALETALQSRVGPVEVWCAPDVAHPFFDGLAKAHGAVLCAQAPGDLGAKMLAAFVAAGGPLLLMGADCPSITAHDLETCAQALRDGADAVFLPAEDGGYGLVGARRALPELFEGVDWGTERVMAQTRAILCARGLSWREPRTVWDVDTPADFNRMVREGLLGARLPQAQLPMRGAED